MPYSSNVFDIKVSNILKMLKPATLLDVGAGAGKYGEMIKKLLPDSISTAIEIESDYIKKFNLGKTYSRVLNMSAPELIRPEYYDLKSDVIILGDVVEHLKKSDGVDLLNFLIYRSKWIIVQFPHKYLQNAVDGYAHEAHISVWGESDFSNFEHSNLYENNGQRLVVLKGYLQSNISIEKLDLILS